MSKEGMEGSRKGLGRGKQEDEGKGVSRPHGHF